MQITCDWFCTVLLTVMELFHKQTCSLENKFRNRSLILGIFWYQNFFLIMLPWQALAWWSTLLPLCSWVYVLAGVCCCHDWVPGEPRAAAQAWRGFPLDAAEPVLLSVQQYSTVQHSAGYAAAPRLPRPVSNNSPPPAASGRAATGTEYCQYFFFGFYTR